MLIVREAIGFSRRPFKERVGSKPGWGKVKKRTSSQLSCDYVGLQNIMFDGSLGAQLR
jgi:hypothetical protein